MQGIVEEIKFTSGGAGNQWTTIGGVRYATFWDIRTMDWKVGDLVEFDTRSGPLWTDGNIVEHALNIRRAVN